MDARSTAATRVAAARLAPTPARRSCSRLACSACSYGAGGGKLAAMAFTCTKVIPILRMFDEAMTKQFYLEFLEFEIVFEHRFHDGAPLYMGIKKGNVELNLSGHFGDGSPGAAVRIEATDLVEWSA